MDENLELLTLVKAGDLNAKEKLVASNLGLVWSIAKRFTGRGYDIEDLFQLGCIGLIKAIDRFDFSFDVKLSTYAVPMITGEIRRFLRDGSSIKCSRSLKELNVRINRYIDEQQKIKGTEPAIEEIAAALSVDKEEIVLAMEAARPLISLDSLETDIRKDDRMPELLDRLMINELLEDLSEQDRQIIELRYFKDKTQSETGKILNLSQVQISRMEKKILAHLRTRVTV